MIDYKHACVDLETFGVHSNCIIHDDDDDDDDDDLHKVERQRALLTCPQASGECLPPIRIKDKSAKLIFADLKNKVCRPLRG